MIIGMLQTDPLVGAFKENAQDIWDGYRRAAQLGAGMAVGSELQFWGYPPRDQLTLKWRVNEQLDVARKLRLNVGNVGLMTGVADWNTRQFGRSLRNTSVLMRNKRIAARHVKRLLPTYDVFDESRYFEPGRGGPSIFEDNGVLCAQLVCEDVWGGTEDPFGHPLYKYDPVEKLVGRGIKILYIINASPYFWGKANVRYDLIAKIAKRLRCIVVFVNQVGGNDSLIFDGRSFALDENGQDVHR